MAENQGLVLILTGPPGAGKSTVADILARRSEQPAVHLHSDDFYDRYIKSGFIKPWLKEAQAQNEAVTGALVAAAFAYARGGFSTFVDGIVGPWFLEPYRKASRESGIALHYVVLRPVDPAISVGRVQNRTEQGLKDETVIRDLYQQFSNLGVLERNVFDPGAASPQDIATALKAKIAAGAFRLA
ncbi:MAG: AAA family ATPase [Rhizomicrobium sp.]